LKLFNIVLNAFPLNAVKAGRDLIAAQTKEICSAVFMGGNSI